MEEILKICNFDERSIEYLILEYTEKGYFL